MYAGEDAQGRPRMVGFDLFSVAKESEIEVWPENEPAFGLFWRTRTQWRVGMGGPTGLDYSSVWRLIDRMRLPDGAADELFEDVQVMEEAALEAMQEKRDG